MSDIFISYTREDCAKAEVFARALENQGWSVWWDRSIPAGKTFDEIIEEAIDAARCIVVLWSKKSVTSRWVRTEAEEGAHRNILLPVLIEDVKIPIAFRRIQAADLVAWHGDVSSTNFVKLIADISGILELSRPQEDKESRDSVDAKTKPSPGGEQTPGAEQQNADVIRTAPESKPHQKTAVTPKDTKWRLKLFTALAVPVLGAVAVYQLMRAPEDPSERRDLWKTADGLAAASDNASGDLSELLAIEAVRLSHDVKEVPSAKALSALVNPESLRDVARFNPRAGKGSIDIQRLRFGPNSDTLYGAARHREVLRSWKLCLDSLENPFCADRPAKTVLLDIAKRPNAVDLGRDNNWLTFRHDESVTVHRLSPALTRTINTTGRSSQFFTDPKNRWLARKFDGGQSIQVVGLPEAASSFTHDAEGGAFTDVAIHPIDQIMLSGTSSGWVYAVPPNQPGVQKRIIEERVRRLAISPDGKTIATIDADANHQLNLYVYQDGAARKMDVTLKHATQSTSDYILEFSDDGSMLASYTKPGNQKRTIAVWRLDTGEKNIQPVLLTFNRGSDAPNHTVLSVAFSQDNGWLAAALGNGYNDVLFWPLTAKTLIELGCQRVERNLTPDEWNEYFGEKTAYRETCEGL